MSADKNQKTAATTTGKEAVAPKQADSKKEVKYVRLTEFNGWEHETWHRYFPVEDEVELKAWTALQTRLVEYNKGVAKDRWAALQKEEKAPKAKSFITEAFYKAMGVTAQAPLVTNTMLTEFEVKLGLSEEEAKKLIEPSGAAEDAGDEGEEEDTDVKEAAAMRAEYEAYKKGDTAFRSFFYRVDQDSGYTEKHAWGDPDHFTPQKLQQLATATDALLHEGLYKHG